MDVARNSETFAGNEYKYAILPVAIINPTFLLFHSSTVPVLLFQGEDIVSLCLGPVCNVILLYCYNCLASPN